MTTWGSKIIGALALYAGSGHESPWSRLFLRRFLCQNGDLRSNEDLAGHVRLAEGRKNYVLCLYREEGCSSTYAYCVEIIHLSEFAAYDELPPREQRGSIRVLRWRQICPTVIMEQSFLRMMWPQAASIPLPPRCLTPYIARSAASIRSRDVSPSSG